jgi:hypothetical protein
VLIRTRQAQGAGNAAYFVRLRRASATSFWDFTNSNWQAAEDADSKTFLTEYADPDTNSLYAAEISPPPLDMVAEIVKVSDNTVVESFDISAAGAESVIATATAVAAGAVDTSVTVAAVISRAARELGLVSADITDPFASTDANVLQLCTLLGSLGARLARQRSWTQLQREYTFQTVAATADYNLPTDFKRFLNQSEWNRDTSLPVGTVAGAREWQALKGSLTGAVFQVQRLSGGQLHLYPTPSAAEDIYFEYQSRYWVSATASSTVLAKEFPTVNSDVLWFDFLMLVDGLKLAFRAAKGLDVTLELQQFNEMVSAAQGNDGLAPVLSLNGAPGLHLIDETNAPDTGLGS